MIQRDGFHAVTAATLPDDAKRILPLIGNDEIKLCVDAHGVMHDLQHIWPSHPRQRITWAGRRHDRRLDEYNSNLFEWGFLNLQLTDEESLPPVTTWRQALHPRDGYVETLLTRGEIEERTVSFVHAERNLIVFHREYRNLPDTMRRLRVRYTLCQNRLDELPYRMQWQPRDRDAAGIEIETAADGLMLYRGRLALFADSACAARVSGNTVWLDIELPTCGTVTVYLALADDLPAFEPHLRIDHDGWMAPGVRDIHREFAARRREAVRPDPVADVRAMREWTAAQGFEGVLASHVRNWNEWFDQVRIDLPAEEAAPRAALDTQLYTIRCSRTAWSFPANPFNTSWGAGYFWDERFPTEGLLQAGLWQMPERVAEFRRSILPCATMGSGGRGARYPSCVVESGTSINDRSHCNLYEFFPIAVFANCIYAYCRYRDEDAVWRRYYPVFSEAAEFYRQYLLAELPGNNLMAAPLVDVNENTYPIQDGPFTVHGAARVFHVAVTVAEHLGIEEKRLPEWRRFGDLARALSRHLEDLNAANRKEKEGGFASNPSGCFCDYELFRLPPPDIDVDDSVLRWRDQKRRELSPGPQLDGKRTGLSGNKESLPFWSWGSLNAAFRAATNRDPDDALRMLRSALRTMMDFGALNESAREDLTDVHHPWFTTAAGAYVRALTRMLVYPCDDEVTLCPGIPSSWRDFRFTLPIHKRGEVALEVKDGTIVELELREQKPGRHRRIVHLPRRFLDARRLAGQIPVIGENDTWLTVETAVAGSRTLVATDPGGA